MCIEGLDFVSEDQEQAIDYYNTSLAPLGWLPVNKVSDELTKALEIFDGDGIRRLVDAVIANSPDILMPKRKTLVRLLWSNY